MSKIYQEIIRPIKDVLPENLTSEMNATLIRSLEENRQRLVTKIDLTYPNIVTGIVAPTTVGSIVIPDKVGDLFIDTVAAKIYISAGNSAATDWKILN